MSLIPCGHRLTLFRIAEYEKLLDLIVESFGLHLPNEIRVFPKPRADRLQPKNATATRQYDFVFRHEVEVLDDLKQLAPQFQTWYNQERLHSTLGYEVPWQRLVADAAVPS